MIDLETTPVLLDADEITLNISNNPILNNVSLCIHSGEFVGLIGPNGAGKTSLLKVLLGLQVPSGGTVSRSAKIGYVPQLGVIAPQLPISVLEVVKLGSGGNSVEAEKALKTVRMQSHKNDQYLHLSGGQQQKVLIAKALAAGADLLILDEPTTGIDSRSQAEFFDILNKLSKQGIAVLLVSHDVGLVLDIVGRVICLNSSVLYDGPPDNFESEQVLPEFYSQKHRLLHHNHGVKHE